MTRTLLISTTLLAFACGHDAARQPPTPQDTATAAVPPPPSAADAPAATTGVANETITLVGCLQGSGPFTLAGARVESNGTNGPRGRLPEVGSTVGLDGVMADARPNVGKQVRVTGRLDTTRPGARSGGPSPSGGSTSTRDDVRANSTTVASDAPDQPRQRLIVERVEAIAETCAAR